MHALNNGKILPVLILVLCLGWAFSACALPANQGNSPAAPQPGGEEDALGEGSDEQGESPIEPEFGSDSLPCPSKGGALILGFDHALTSNYQDVSMTHFLHQGQMLLMIVDDQGTIASQGSPSIPYTMEGRMTDVCALTGQGSMIPSAHGSCENGVVSLFINENWMALDGEMTCVEPDGDTVTMPFDVPAMGLRQHSGADGAGEIFYIVEGSEGYSSMRPFAEGEGYHTWTLYTEEIPIVPLVP